MEQKPFGKATSSQLVKKFPAFYGNRRYITIFTRTLHWFLSWARRIQSTPCHLIFLRAIVILCSPLLQGLPSGLFPSGFSTKILYAFPISPIRATCPANPVISARYQVSHPYKATGTTLYKPFLLNLPLIHLYCLHLILLSQNISNESLRTTQRRWHEKLNFSGEWQVVSDIAYDSPVWNIRSWKLCKRFLS